MGNARSGNHFHKKDLLDDSSWLKKIVTQYQKNRNCGVSSFSDFCIEKTNNCTSDESGQGGTSVHRVSISFKNGNNKQRKANWIIKTSYNDSLSLEVRIYAHLLTDVYKYLSCRSNVRVRYLLNIPEMILYEQVHEQTSRRNSLAASDSTTIMALILEDLTKTKSCLRVKAKEVSCGLNLAQFKLFLGTLAQFHAVGFAWSTSFGDDSLLDSHPYLHRSQRQEDYSVLFDRYKNILDYAERTKMFPDMPRRKNLFSQLCKTSDKLLNCDVEKDLSSPLSGLCLGAPVPSDVLFRYECSLPSILDGQEAAYSNPICAAVNTCHRIHFGNVIRELATSFFTLPCPIVRVHYLTLMLQNYCQAFTLTSELLEVNTRKKINYTFEDVLRDFYEFVPSGILRAIVLHMRRTHCSDIQLLNSSSNGHFPDEGSFTEGYYIPLSNSRIRFLVALLDPVKKCV